MQTIAKASGPGIGKTLQAAISLEWQARGNWTNPVAYTLFLTARPITAALVLVLMYRAISGPNAHGAALGFLVVGSAAWTFVEQIMSGLPQTIMADREEYAMLKYVYIAPQSFLTFLVGRTVPRMATSVFSSIITLAFGVLLLGVPFNWAQVNPWLLLIAMALGMIAIIALGLAFAGLSLVLKRGAWQMPDAVAGALYLVTGAIFPIARLPGWLQTIALGVPLTHWLELTRRALLGPSAGPTFGYPIADTRTVLLMLIVTTAITAVAGVLTFRICEYYARERGQLDRTTGS